MKSPRSNSNRNGSRRFIGCPILVGMALREPETLSNLRYGLSSPRILALA